MPMNSRPQKEKAGAIDPDADRYEAGMPEVHLSLPCCD
jgi:hypothetical protein